MKRTMTGIKTAAAFLCFLLLYCLPVSAETETGDAGPGILTGLEGITADNYPKVDGSTATLPLSQAVYRLVSGCTQQEADEAVVHTKTTNSYLRLIAGECDLLIVADKNEKVDRAVEESGVALEISPIALDAFTFMTNEENPVKSLTKEQIVGIYAGEITNWSQVGGEDRKIIPFQRNENAGSQTAMKSLVMQGRELTDAEEMRIYTMSDLLEAVAAYNNEANALGYSYYYYASLMYRTPGLRFMAVDGVMPSNETVQDGSYPYIAGYYAVIRKDEGDTPARRIFQWLSGRAGQEMIADLGYVPVDQNVQPKEIHADETAAGPLPIGEDECLAVMTGKTTLTFIDRDGRVTRRMENTALAEDSEAVVSASPVRMEVLKKDQPVTLMVRKEKENLAPGLVFYGEGSLFLAGEYLPSEDRFMLEPSYYSLYSLSDSLATNSAATLGPGVLLKKDGTVIDGTEHAYYSRMGEYIVGFSHDYTSGEGSVMVYDTVGNLLFRKEGEGGYSIQMIGKDRFLTVEDRICRCLDERGNTVWAYKEGFMPANMAGDYIDWVNFDRQLYQVTDSDLNLVLNAELFRKKNPNIMLPEVCVYVLAVSPDGEKVLLSDYGNDHAYYLCDSRFHILERFPSENICLEWPADSSQPAAAYMPVPWEFLVHDGRCLVRNLFSGSTFEFTDDESQTGGLTNGGYVRSIGGLTVLCLSNRESRNVTIVFTEDGMVRFFREAWPVSEVYPGVLRLRKDLGDTTFFDVSLSDGKVLTGTHPELIYDGNGLNAIRRGSWLYLEDEAGKLILRILAETEDGDS